MRVGSNPVTPIPLLNFSVVKGLDGAEPVDVSPTPWFHSLLPECPALQHRPEQGRFSFIFMLSSYTLGQLLVFFLNYLFYLFIFGCVGSSFLCEGFLQLQRVGATLHRGARASHCRGLSCCGAQAPDAQAQQLWLTGPVAPQHVGSSQTRTGTRVPCLGRRTPNHCATREAPPGQF